jgi:hypothetical protein
MIKLLTTWDIKSGKESEYFEFTVREFAPGVMRLGLRPTEAWYTVYGDDPQILMGFVTDDLDTMVKIINGSEWSELHNKLLEYVTGYRQKIVRATSRFQLF